MPCVPSDVCVCVCLVGQFSLPSMDVVRSFAPLPSNGFTHTMQKFGLKFGSGPSFFVSLSSFGDRIPHWIAQPFGVIRLEFSTRYTGTNATPFFCWVFLNRISRSTLVMFMFRTVHCLALYDFVNSIGRWCRFSVHESIGIIRASLFSPISF